jgi:hypothetical protein
MRRTRVVAAFVASLAAGPALAAGQCLRPAERSAFDIAGLKSQLMVTALTCDARDKYNGFVNRFRQHLAAQEKALHAYFVRVFGAGGQRAHDDYITSLANVQSQNGLRDGTLFCQRNAALLDEVLMLQKPEELARYAASKPLVQPIELTACPGGPEKKNTIAAR